MLSFFSRLVSASFPFNKFSFILEYGGSKGSSRISSLSPKLAGLPLHFIKVELDESTASRALCEGVDMPQNMKAVSLLPSRLDAYFCSFTVQLPFCFYIGF